MNTRTSIDKVSSFSFSSLIILGCYNRKKSMRAHRDNRDFLENNFRRTIRTQKHIARYTILHTADSTIRFIKILCMTN